MKSNNFLRINFLILLLFSLNFAFSEAWLQNYEFSKLKDKAYNGDKKAQNKVGDAYYLGKIYSASDSKDYVTAVEWYRKSAEQGYAPAQYNLGNCYEKGHGVSQSYSEAAKWYKLAAEQGHVESQCNLGLLYQNGLGVKKDEKEAFTLYKKAADKGHPEAFLYVGLCFAQGIGVSQDYSEAAKWYQKAMDKGILTAQNNLGVLYLNGEGVKKDYSKAVSLFTKASEKGFANAQNNLGKCYQNGWGVIVNWYEAAKWFQKAADQNLPEAQFNIAFCFENGKGVKKNLNEAAFWYRLAASKGYNNAQENLDNLLANDPDNKFANPKLKNYPKLYTLDNFKTIDYGKLRFAEFKTMILTWEEYYDSNKKLSLTNSIQNIENKIKKEIQTWQKKDEFETTDQWQQRVNETTRNDKIEKLKKSYLAIYEKESKEINEEKHKLAEQYNNYREQAVSKYFAQKKKAAEISFSNKEFMLNPYDADNQTFLIHAENYGDILLPVSMEDAPSFKSNWYRIKQNVKPEFIPNGEDVTLVKLIFYNNGKEYVYDNNTVGNYALVNIDYNFAPVEITDIDLADININNLTDIPVYDKKLVTLEKNTEKTITGKNYQPSSTSIQATKRSTVDYDIPTNPQMSSSTTFAVIIGNEEYNNVSNVPFAQQDCRIFGKYLSQAVGVPQENIKIFENASYGNIAAALKHINNLSLAYGDKLNLIFYYAGHGAPNEKNSQAMLLPVDGDASIPETCYDLGKIYSELGSMTANSVLVLLDACFSGSQRGEGMLVDARSVRIKASPSKPTGKMIILSASQGDEIAFPYEQEGHGMFTYFLLKKLQENKGNVTLGELSDYIIEKVKQQSVVTNGKIQTPNISVSPFISSSWRDIHFGK